MSDNINIEKIEQRVENSTNVQQIGYVGQVVVLQSTPKTPPKVKITPSRWKNRVSISMRSLNGIGFEYDWYVVRYNGTGTVKRMADYFTPDREGQGLTVSLDLSDSVRSIYVEELLLGFSCTSTNIKEIPFSEQAAHRKCCMFRLKWHPHQEKMEIFTEAGDPVESLEVLTQAEYKATNSPKTVPHVLPEKK